MIEALAELAFLVIGLFIELFVSAIFAVISPARMAVSADYRERKRRLWRDSRARQLIDITGWTLSATILMAIAFLFCWSCGFMQGGENAPEAARAAERVVQIEDPDVAFQVKMKNGDHVDVKIEIEEDDAKRVFHGVIEKLNRKTIQGEGSADEQSE